MNPLKRTGPENPFESASGLKKSNLKELKVPAPVIYQNWESKDPNDYILMKGKEKISLTPFAKGCFHKVYTMANNPGHLIKTPLGSIDDASKKKTIQESSKAYQKLIDHPDLRPCRIFNDILQDGYYEVEYVKEEFDLEDFESLAPIRKIIAKMVTDPDQYFIHDFFPRNVRKGEDGEVVMIDFSDRVYQEGGVEENEKIKDLAEDISKFIRKWSKDDADNIQVFLDEIKSQAPNQELLVALTERLSS